MNIEVKDSVNFAELIKLNSNFTTNIQSKLANKMNETFVEEEQRWYAANLYMYMNYHPTDEFPIDLGDVYSMIGFVNKQNAKKTLVNNFVENDDYRVYEDGEAKAANPVAVAAFNETNRNLGGAGQNKQRVMLNTDTFKNLCMIARTELGKNIRKYYVKLETIFNSMIKETIDEMKAKTVVKIRSKEEKIIDQFPENEMCIYIADIGTIDDEHLVKFGETNNLKQRVTSHRKTFKNFELITAYKVVNSRKFENLLKEVPEVSYRKRNKEISGKNKEELMMVDSVFNIEDLNKVIKNLIEKHCTLESYLADIDLRKAEIDLRKAEIDLRKAELHLELKRLELSQQPVDEVKTAPGVVVSDQLKRNSKYNSSTKEDDLVKKFMDNETSYSDNDKDYITLDSLYSEFERWNSTNNKPISRTKFAVILQKVDNYRIARVNTDKKSKTNNRFLRLTSVTNRNLKR